MLHLAHTQHQIEDVAWISVSALLLTRAPSAPPLARPTLLHSLLCCLISCIHVSCLNFMQLSSIRAGSVCLCLCFCLLPPTSAPSQAACHWRHATCNCYSSETHELLRLRLPLPSLGPATTSPWPLNIIGYDLEEKFAFGFGFGLAWVGLGFFLPQRHRVNKQ